VDVLTLRGARGREVSIFVGGKKMYSDAWIKEYIKGWLCILGKFKKRILADEVKLLFAIPVESNKLLEIAEEVGFEVDKKHGYIIVEIKQNSQKC